MVVTIPVEIDAKETNTEGKYAYVVALAVGGVMEDPEIRHVDPQIIRADSEEEARNKYNSINRCRYYYGTVLCRL